MVINTIIKSRNIYISRPSMMILKQGRVLTGGFFGLWWPSVWRWLSWDFISMGQFQDHINRHYCKILQCLTDIKSMFKIFWSLWNLAGILTALFQRCLWNLKVIWAIKHPLLPIEVWRSYDKMNYGILNWAQEFLWLVAHTEALYYAQWLSARLQ